jgi:hypothetical protein
VVEMHPAPTPAHADGGGVELGEIESSNAIRLMRDTEQLTQEAVAEGLFTIDRTIEFTYLERFDSAGELIGEVSEWNGYYAPLELRRTLRNAQPPCDARLAVVANRLRPEPIR